MPKKPRPPRPVVPTHGFANASLATTGAQGLAQIFQRAVEAFRRGDRGEVERLCRHIIAANADHYDALTLLGIVAAQSQRPTEAVALLSRAAALRPTHAEAHNNLGIVLRGLGRHAEALACFDRALLVKPDYAEALNNRGMALRCPGRHDEALACFDRALFLKPDYAEAHNNRGVTLCDLGNLEEAIASFDRALSLMPAYSEALNNCGVALVSVGRPSDALACFNRALAIRPDDAMAMNNRGNALSDLRRNDEALASYERALALAPDSATIRYDLALFRLLLGDFARGWLEHEWRWKQPKWAAIRRDFAQPLWLGAEPLDGKTLLLHHEQGLGDTLQFCRYARLAAARGARVVLVVQPPLVPLLTGLDSVAEVLPTGAALPPFDFHCPLLSLPLAFGTRPETIPPPIVPRSDPTRLAVWCERLGEKSRPRIGLAWSGNPGNRNDRNRSLALAELAPLLSQDFEWISLQKDVRADDGSVLTAYPGIRHFGAGFADTAALIELTDLVIAVDTSIAHLAGTMGKRVWILLAFNADWRWPKDGDDSPWYPTARLFRQPALGDWASVVERLRGELAALA